MDSGGTSTNTYALSYSGEIIDQITTGCGSPAVDFEYANRNIYDSIEKIYQNNINNHLISIALGISGLGAVPNVSEMKEEIEKKYQVPCIIVTDAHIALFRLVDLTNSKDAVILIAGTGNACLGTNSKEVHLTGGGGPLLDEAGSAYSFTHRLSLNIKHNFEIGKEYTNLQKACLKYFNCKDFPELKTFFYNHTKEEIASFTKTALNSSLDEEAKALIKDQAKYLMEQVNLQYQYFKFENKLILGLLGGFFHHNELLSDEIKKIIKNNNLNIELITNIDKIYLGALLLAKQLGNK